ncbi:MAG TPA: Dabb family protein [Humisphaera sp.]
MNAKRLALFGLSVLLAGGCAGSGTQSSQPRQQYGREGPAIAMARDRADVTHREQAAIKEAERKAEIDQAAAAKLAEQEKAPAINQVLAERDQLLKENRQLLAQNAQLRGADDAKPAQVKHLVLVWLKNKGDAAARQAIIDAGAQLRTIPGVVDVSAGTMLPSPRPVVDSTYDVGVVITFASEQAMRDYDQHPTHKKVVAEVLKPVMEKFVVYDFAVK